MWHPLSLQACTKALRKKKGSALDQISQGLATIKAAATDACGVLIPALEGTAGGADAAGIEASLMQGSEASMLWGWGKGFDPAAALRGITKEQAKILAGLTSLAGCHAKSLAACRQG